MQLVRSKESPGLRARQGETDESRPGHERRQVRLVGLYGGQGGMREVQAGLLRRRCPFVVLEVDGHQQPSYACECEQLRMINLSQSLGLPKVFLRYNPDRYCPVDASRPKRAPKQERALAAGRVCEALVFSRCLTHLLKTEQSPAAR